MDEIAIIEKIKRIRRNKNLTLKRLAEKTELSEGYLSRIENSQNLPPISTLDRIAQGLDTDISYILQKENHLEDENPDIVILKRDEYDEKGFPDSPQRKYIKGDRYQQLAEKKTGKNMQPYIVVVGFDRKETTQHHGEEFLFILSGRLELLFGVDKHILERGDSAYFDANIPHIARSIGQQKAKVLLIMHHYKRL